MTDTASKLLLLFSARWGRSALAAKETAYLEKQGLIERRQPRNGSRPPGLFRLTAKGRDLKLQSLNSQSTFNPEASIRMAK
jgi:hypothetical protein